MTDRKYCGSGGGSTIGEASSHFKPWPTTNELLNVQVDSDGANVIEVCLPFGKWVNLFVCVYVVGCASFFVCAS